MSVALAIAVVVLRTTQAPTWALVAAIAALLASVARSLWLER